MQNLDKPHGFSSGAQAIRYSAITVTRNGLAVKSVSQCQDACGLVAHIRERHRSANSGKDLLFSHPAGRLAADVCDIFPTIRYDLRGKWMKAKTRPRRHCRFNNSSARLRRLSKNSSTSVGCTLPLFMSS